MPRPQTSVILPAFRAHDTIAQAVSSLADPGLSEACYEVLVESDDGTPYDWLASLGPQVKPASGPSGTGPGPTRNRALARAKGDWITCLDADDHVAPGYLRALLETAHRQGAALAETRVTTGAQTLFAFGGKGQALDFDTWAQTGVSLRGLFHRDVFAPFVDAPAQDILQLIECWLRHGPRLEFSKAVYFLTLGDDTETTQPGFAERVAQAYDLHVRYLTDCYPEAALLPQARAFWQAKAALNQAYQAYTGPLSYYEFVHRGL